MKVLHITNAGGFGRVQSGGAERAVGELSSALADQFGWDEYVFAPAEFLDRQGFSDAVTKLPGELSSFGLPSALSPKGELQSAIRSIEPDVIVGHLLRGTISGAAAARLASRAKFVSVLHSSLHDVGSGEPPAGLKAKLNLAGFGFVGRRFVDLHVAISEANRRDLIYKDRIPGSRTAMIHNWVSNEFAPSEQLAARVGCRCELQLGAEEFVMAIVGRVEAGKNHEFIIRILPDLPKGRLLVLGKGALEERLKQVAEEVGVSERVHFLGHRDPVAQFMEAADVVLVPSLFEGFGRTVVEGLAVGTPIISSDLEAVREIFELLPCAPHKLVPMNDRPAWIAAIDARSVARRPTYADRRELATAVQGSFSLTAAASAYDAALRGLVENHE